MAGECDSCDVISEASRRKCLCKPGFCIECDNAREDPDAEGGCHLSALLGAYYYTQHCWEHCNLPHRHKCSYDEDDMKSPSECSIYVFMQELEKEKDRRAAEEVTDAMAATRRAEREVKRLEMLVEEEARMVQKHSNAKNQYVRMHAQHKGQLATAREQVRLLLLEQQ